MEGKNYKTLKIQLYPTSRKKHLMDKTAYCSGVVYNAFIYIGRYLRKNENRFPTKNELRGMISKIWNNCVWMQDIPNNCLFECANNAIKSLKDCYNNYKNDTGSILPKYKKIEDFDEFGFLSNTRFELKDVYYKEEGKRKRYLHLSKIGEIRARNMQNQPPGIPKTCHIKRKTIGHKDEYFASITYDLGNEYQRSELDLTNLKPNPVGLDIGIKNIAVLSTGEIYENKEFHKSQTQVFTKLHHSLSKLPRYSEEYSKCLSKLQHTYNKLQNKRLNEIYRISKEIVYSNGQIFAEDISIRNLQKKTYSSKMSDQYNDACLGKFQKRLITLSEEFGKQIKFVNPAYTSQMCSQCKNIIKKKLETRIHECPFCGLTIDRDVNAAINILHIGLASNPSER